MTEFARTLLRIPTPADVFNAVLRSDLTAFIEKCFVTLHPGVLFRPNWHVEAIAWHLQKVLNGHHRRLIITMPPRSLKSVSASVAFPAFLHGHTPNKHIVCVSYGQDLAVKLHNDYRAVLGSDWYRRVCAAVTKLATGAARFAAAAE